MKKYVVFMSEGVTLLSRPLDDVPPVGDIVRLAGNLYKVYLREWVLDSLATSGQHVIVYVERLVVQPQELRFKP